MSQDNIRYEVAHLAWRARHLETKDAHDDIHLELGFFLITGISQANINIREIDSARLFALNVVSQDSNH